MSGLKKITGNNRRYCLVGTCANRADWVEVVEGAMYKPPKEMAYCEEHKPQLKIKPVPLDEFGKEK